MFQTPTSLQWSPAFPRIASPVACSSSCALGPTLIFVVRPFQQKLDRFQELNDSLIFIYQSWYILRFSHTLVVPPPLNWWYIRLRIQSFHFARVYDHRISFRATLKRHSESSVAPVDDVFMPELPSGPSYLVAPQHLMWMRTGDGRWGQPSPKGRSSTSSSIRMQAILTALITLLVPTNNSSTTTRIK